MGTVWLRGRRGVKITTTHMHTWVHLMAVGTLTRCLVPLLRKSGFGNGSIGHVRRSCRSMGGSFLGKLGAHGGMCRSERELWWARRRLGLWVLTERFGACRGIL